MVEFFGVLHIGWQLYALVLQYENVAFDKLVELLGNLRSAAGSGSSVAAAMGRRNQLLVGLICDRK